MSRVRRRLAAVPDVDARVSRPVLFSTRTPIEVEVHGEVYVVMRERDVPLEAVWTELDERFGRAPRTRSNREERRVGK